MASNEELLREAANPATSPARLQEIAQADQSTWAAIAANPAAYDGLLTWLGEHGDATVKAAIAARSAVAAPPAPAVAAAPAVPAAAPVPPTPPVPGAPAAAGTKSNTGLIITVVVLGIALVVGLVFLLINLLGPKNDVADPGTGPVVTDPANPQPDPNPIDPNPQPNPNPNPTGGDVCQQILAATMQWGQQNQNTETMDFGSLYVAWGNAVGGQIGEDFKLVGEAFTKMMNGDMSLMQDPRVSAASERVEQAVSGCEDAFQNMGGLGGFGF